MELYVYDLKFNWLGIIDDFDCLIWETNYQTADTMQLEIATKDTSLNNLLQRDMVIYRDVKEAEPVPFIIEESGFKDDAQTGLITYTVSGSSPETWLTRRFTGLKETKKGKAGNVAAEFIKSNATEPIRSARKIQEYLLSADTTKGKEIEVEAHYKNLYDTIVGILEDGELGIKCYADFKKKKYVLKIFEGIDRTRDQKTNKKAIFSAEFDNISDQSYNIDARDYKNFALVAGVGEDAARKTLEVFEVDGQEPTGLNRREVFIDARDLSDKRTVGEGEGQTEEPIPEAEYNKMLKERGKEKLKEYIIEKMFECNVISTQGLQFKRDYNVGDRVTIENKKMNINAAERIVAIEETYDVDGYGEIKAKIGTKIFNVLDRL